MNSDDSPLINNDEPSPEEVQNKDKEILRQDLLRALACLRKAQRWCWYWRLLPDYDAEAVIRAFYQNPENEANLEAYGALGSQFREIASFLEENQPTSTIESSPDDADKRLTYAGILACFLLCLCVFASVHLKAALIFVGAVAVLSILIIPLGYGLHRYALKQMKEPALRCDAGHQGLWHCLAPPESSNDPSDAPNAQPRSRSSTI